MIRKQFLMISSIVGDGQWRLSVEMMSLLMKSL